jgi:hypothetical protein
MPGIFIADEIVDMGHIWEKAQNFFLSSWVNGVPTLTIEPTSVPSSRSVTYSWRGLLLEEMGPTPSNMYGLGCSAS